MLKAISRFLSDPRLKGVDVNSDKLLEVHQRILREKPLMNKVFSDFYDQCMQLDKRYFSGEGLRVELGAGVSFFKDKYPDVLITDIKKAAHLDRVLDAQQIDLPDATVRAFYGINCFHHFPEPRQFFHELKRTLVPGGGCVLIEPYYGPLASVLYKNLFDSESFDKTQKSWHTDTRVMLGANQALSYIVLIRDRTLFEEEFPELEVVATDVMNNYGHYLLSGGLNFRPLVPNFLHLLPDVLAKVCSPCRRTLGLHYYLVIRKRKK